MVVGIHESTMMDACATKASYGSIHEGPTTINTVLIEKKDPCRKSYTKYIIDI